ncbi:glycosyltransferase [Scytonema sp. UIC 10036]|uniref:glycosyltransferase family 4 protein n=1 Tax=Scytonema sp. UIC 10036 TaxID=2304196 RepID=UPI0012DAD140|nr:glycosyltransferase [Scytonema sp. UIC 10036]MUH01195.1 glycosyltransferase [Scytonema sp. UIC 10036]
MNSQNVCLTVLLNYQVKSLQNSQVIMSRKFFDEMSKFSSFWPGKMRLLIEQNPANNELLETVTVKPEELPYELQIVSYQNLQPAVLLKNTSIVYTAVGHKHNTISQQCKLAGVPCIYISEYSLKARKQINNITTNNPIIRWRRNLWAENQERKQVKGIKLANGIQCNGTPTYDEYRQINSNAFLYFDNRVPDSLLAKYQEVEERTSYLCERDEPLRLCFSGRLIEMKGADHLIDIAQELKQLGVRFQMFIFGNGDLQETMQSRIAASELSDSVKMMGMLSFNTQLLPFVKKNVDLFVCCHRQSDPSCTYLETMSCGVPIIGYNNEAFAGVVQHSRTGWLIEMDRPKALAQKIAELDKNRQLIREQSFQALDFAKEHSFEKTYERRLRHIQETCYNFYGWQQHSFSLV